jgi:SAM-dependent methyltransferase
MNCDGCRARDASTLLETGDRRFGLPGSFAVVRCRACGLVRTDPVPDDLGAYYPNAQYYSYQAPGTPSERTRRRVRAAYGGQAEDGSRLRGALGALVRDRLLPGLPPGPPGDVLDVGCGSGAFLLALREAGWRVHGVELSASAVEAARAAGLADVRAGDLMDAGYPAERFDAVRFWHSLEHMPSPREQLTEARRVLRRGGTLTIGVPNFSSFLARAARDRWYYLDVPRHLWHFEPATLSRLVDRTGFRVTRNRTVSGGTALLGTIDYLRGSRENLANSRAAWYAALPVGVLLDALGRGDGLELIAVAS